jgi:predicted permease
VRWSTQAAFYLRSLFQRRQLDRQLEEEIQAHVDLATEDYMAKGMKPEDARHAALREFGNVPNVQEQARDEWGWIWLDQLRQDLSHAWNGLARSHGFVFAVVLILGLGMGVASAIFSLLQETLLRRVAFPPNLYVVCLRGDGSVNPRLSDYMTRGYERSPAVAESAKVSGMGGNVAIDGLPSGNLWYEISPNMLGLLKVTPALGRDFLAGEDQPGADNVVIISDMYWRRNFSADPDILGRKISLGPDVCTVVGVLKPNQIMPMGMIAHIYRPLVYQVDSQRPWAPVLSMLVKLQPGFSPQQAAEALNAMELVMPVKLMPADAKKPEALLMSVTDFDRQYGPAGASWVLLAGVGFLYGISCLNTSNLMLVRMLGRKRELSIRLALGASRWRIMRLILAESMMLSLAGAAAGILMTNWFFPLMLRTMSDGLLSMEPSLDWRNLLSLAFVTVVTGLAVAAIPAVRVLRAQISVSLRDGGAAFGESRGLGRIRSALVVVQTSLAVVLMVGAGLMSRTLLNFTRIDLGYDGTQRVKVQLVYPPGYPTDAEPRLAKLHEIQAVLERQPGVAAAGFCNDLFLQNYFAGTHTVAGAGGEPVKAMVRCFSRGFEQTSGLRIIRGRPLGQIRSNEILVSETLANQCWPGKDPLGQLLRPVGGAPGFGDNWKGWLVVGLVADTRPGMRKAPVPIFYSDEAWNPVNYDTYVLRLNVPYYPEVDPAIRRALYAYDPQLVVAWVTPLDRLWEYQMRTEKLVAAALKLLGGAAVLLTMAGLFTVLAYAVDRRMHEFGVRLALGASRTDLVRLVVKRGVALVATGLVLGLAGGTALARSIQAFLYNTSPQEPMVLITVGGILLAVGALACILPSYRATKVDVTRLLRTE